MALGENGNINDIDLKSKKLIEKLSVDMKYLLGMAVMSYEVV